MSKLPVLLASRSHSVSFEIVPPQRGHCLKEILESVEKLCAFNPAFISVTKHPCVEYRCSETNSSASTKTQHRDSPLVTYRPGSFGISVSIRERFGCLVIPHLIGLGCTEESFEDELIDLAYAGFEDFFFIKGDSQKLFKRHPEYSEIDTLTMVHRARAIRRGEYLYTETPGTELDFSIGVAGYPENSNDQAISALKQKIDAGAEWIITQMLFDNDLYTRYRTILEAHGINVPIIPGTRLITSVKSIALIEKTFGVTMPGSLKKAMEEARTPQEEREAGLCFSTVLLENLYRGGAPLVHIFTMGRSADVSELLKRIR